MVTAVSDGTYGTQFSSASVNIPSIMGLEIRKDIVRIPIIMLTVMLQLNKLSAKTGRALKPGFFVFFKKLKARILD